jgi:hypothetical protein
MSAREDGTTLIGRRIHLRRGAAAAIALSAGAVLLVATRPARAELTVDHEPGSGGCAEAVTYFPEDQSRQAIRARQRCRLETFEQRMENDRLQKEIQAENDRDKLVQSWLDKQEIPVRVFRRVALDGYLGGGITTYGLAVGAVLLPWLETELSIGRRDVNGLVNEGYFQDSRTCWGGRFKFDLRNRGNLTPFISSGLFFCNANVALNSYGGPTIAGGPNNPTSGNGTAAAHLVGAGLGVSWMDKSGLRASVEYLFTYAFYTQATLSDAAHTEDPNLTTAWSGRLGTEQNGFRVQVGYAF